jgi:hypothetical protein
VSSEKGRWEDHARADPEDLCGDDDGLEVPCSQFPQGKREVYWNFEASPQTKAELNRCLSEADAVSPVVSVKTAHVFATPKWRLVPKSAKSRDESENSCGVIESVQEIYQKLLETKAEDANPNNLKSSKSSSISSAESEDILGDSVDDSFLVRCSQAIEQSKVLDSAGKKNENDDPFNDEDDSFDVLMSQFDDIGELVSKEEEKKKELSNSNIDNLPVVKLKVATNLNETCFKRFKSDTLSPPPSNSSSSLCRAKSTPDIPAGSKPSLPGGRSRVCPVQPRCSQEEIERKRQEALLKRQSIQKKSGSVAK